MSYAETNGISLYYEEHGTGDPLVLLHGGFGSLENFDGVREALSAGRRLVLVDLQGHGRTPDADRPLRIETLADDVAGLIEQLGGTADVLGYSFGGEVALRLAIQHPERVRNLVVVSVAAKRDGNFPEGVALFDQMTPEFAGILRQGPVWQTYERVAPDPAAFDTVVAKTVDLLHHDYDWTAEVEAMTPRTLLRVRRRGLDPPRPRARVRRPARDRASRRGLGRLRQAGQPARRPAGHDPLRHHDLAVVRAGGGGLPSLQPAGVGAEAQPLVARELGA